MCRFGTWTISVSTGVIECVLYKNCQMNNKQSISNKLSDNYKQL